MKRILTIAVLLMSVCALTQAQKMPKRADVLKAMNCANDYFIRKYPDATKPTFVKRERPRNAQATCGHVACISKD